MSNHTRLVEVRANILKQNDVVARELREQFRQAGVSIVSLVSSPGSGKTAFLEVTLRMLRSRFCVAALGGPGANPANYYRQRLSFRSGDDSNCIVVLESV